MTSVSWLWLGMDAVGRTLGGAGSIISSRPLSVGATFAGVDFVVLAATVWAGCVLTGGQRGKRAFGGLAAVILAECGWLVVLAQALRLTAVVDPEALLKTWSWQGLLAAAVPWNLPVLAMPIFLAVVWWMLRGMGEGSGFRVQGSGGVTAEKETGRQGDKEQQRRTEEGSRVAGRGSNSGSGGQGSTGKKRARAALVTAAAVVLAAVLPALTTLSWGLRPLEGRKVVASANVYGNWERPVHGQYGRLSIGMYGMLDQFVQSLGGKFAVSEHLTAQDLKGASVLVVIYPCKEWEAGQVDRILRFAADGGTVLVFGEHTILEADGGQRFNDILRHTKMRVRFDTAEWAIGGWPQSLEAMGHPAFTGIPDDRYGVVIGASVEAHYPARPLLIGKWGFCDRADASNGLSRLGNQRLDADEAVGDVILAAEQPYGRGRVVVFGDTSSMINGIVVGSHVFTSRLLAYCAAGGVNPQAWWRQWLAIAVLASLMVMVVTGGSAWRSGLVAMAAAASLGACTWYTSRANEVLPDGRGMGAINKLAYIDDSHLEAFSGEAIREDLREGGLEGLTLTLMRSGYLTLMLPEFSARRIERAGVLVSIAPSKEPVGRGAARQYTSLSATGGSTS